MVTNAEQVADQLKGLSFLVEFKSMPGLDHGGIIGGARPEAALLLLRDNDGMSEIFDEP